MVGCDAKVKQESLWTNIIFEALYYCTLLMLTEPLGLM
jgi:hypothetical protein